MDEVQQLAHAQCLLLAVSLASDANVQALQALTSQRSDIFEAELTLRILLSYLPESLDPVLYVPFLAQLGSGESSTQPPPFPVDTSTVAELSDQDARRQVKRVRLLKLHDSQQRRDQVQDPLVLFLIHRSLRIDQETGLLHLVPQLVSPFLSQSPYLRVWFTSVVLPLLRLDYEYYPQPAKWTALQQFEQLDGLEGVNVLLSKATKAEALSQSLETADLVSRDLRGIVGPWVHGSTLRKRRRTSAQPENDPSALDGWQDVFRWIVNTATSQFELAAKTIEGWDGPADVDLGGYDETSQDGADSTAELQYHLRSKYYQAAFAAIYASDVDDEAGLQSVHDLLTRIADMGGFERPARDLDAELVGSGERVAMPLDEIPKLFLQSESFLRSDQPLTVPTPDSYQLLQQLVTTTRLLASLGHGVSVCKTAKLRFWSDESEQQRLLQKMIESLRRSDNRTEQDLLRIRRRLLWLWSWGVEDDDDDDAEQGYGIFGKLKKTEIEEQMLKAMCSASHYQLAVSSYLPATVLTEAKVEAVVVETVLGYYDNASNGNRMRGGMKKASDMVAAFRKPLPSSALLSRLSSLIAATHSLSFYSLTLQQGVPLQPVAIRTQQDALTLLERVLEQNPRSYTKLDDLIQIGRQLAIALDHDASFRNPTPQDAAEEASRAVAVERRVLGLAIEAALREEDFETAYSYVVNRLPSPKLRPSSSAGGLGEQDDSSWRAAFAAGRHRTSPSAQSKPSGSSATTSPAVRRLEQRMELLSTAMLLAPRTALPEVLAAWRRCEEELLTVLAAETAEEQAFDDRADAGGPVRVPGQFASQEPGFMVQPRRKELGRGAAEEAPMGLFDVARGAAQALGRSAAAGMGGAGDGRAAAHSRTLSGASSVGGGGGDDGRPRKRDVVASAVTGGLISGMSWVLGAKPVGSEGEGEGGEDDQR